MPRKDRQARYAYQRDWYAKNRERVMQAHRDYREKRCTGVCAHCGGPTRGDSPNNVPTYCAKPECAQARRQGIAIKKGEHYDRHRRDGAH